MAAFVAVGSIFMMLGGVLRNPVEARLSRLAPVSVGSTKEAPFSDRVMIPVVDGIVKFIIQLLPPAFVARVSRQLLAAGSPMSTQGFFTLVFVTGVAFPLAALFFLLQAVDSAVVIPVILAIFFSVLGVMLPFFWLRRRVRSRKAAIWKRLSDAFDLVTVCVEAGLGLDAALRQAANRMKGPLAEEIALMLRQVGMGRPRREALEEMAYRIDIPEMTTFVNSIIQAEQLGTSLGRTLRAQAVSLRTHRRQRAEEHARRAPVKMVFPLVLFIMPTFFIVTIGPIAVHLVKYLSEG
jgi:tight adherence protein C